MMITQPAIMYLEAAWRRLVHRSLDVEPPPVPYAAAPAAATKTSSAPPIAAVAAAAEPPPSPTPIADSATPYGPLTAAERRARAAALRALALSRGRHFDAARAAFTDAARLDPRLDLTRTPAFWKLERSAHEAAIEAYVAAGRDRDAAVLRARVRSTFRPKALRPKHTAAIIP